MQKYQSNWLQKLALEQLLLVLQRVTLILSRYQLEYQVVLPLLDLMFQRSFIVPFDMILRYQGMMVELVLVQ